MSRSVRNWGHSAFSATPKKQNVPIKQRGAVLLPVVIAIVLLASITFMLSNQAVNQANIVAAELERDRLTYVAEAGLAHARSQLALNASCDNYADIPKTAFAGETYSVAVSPNNGSPVSIVSSADLQGGKTLTLSSEAVPTYQPPSTVVLQFSETDGKDVSIDSFYDDANYGSFQDIMVRSNPLWIQRPLLEFDISAVPTGVHIVSATLELAMSSVSVAGDISVHRMTRSWLEGTGKGTGNADGATWNDYDGNNPWTQPGGEFDTAPYATTAVSSDKNGQWVSWEIRDLVAGWASGSFPNFGLVLVGDGTVNNAQFASREDGDPTLAPRLTIVYACECGKTCGAAPPAGNNVLLVVLDPVNMTAQDTAKQALIKGWGHTVNLIDDDAAQSEFDAAYAINDVVYMSEEVNSGTLSTKLRNAYIGVVFEEQKIPDELGVSSGESVYFETSIDITDNSHYITETFSTGPLTIVSSSQEVGDLGGTLAPDLQVLAVKPSSTRPTLAFIETGGALFDGGTAEGRRVKVPWGGNTFDINALTADGQTIMQRAIEWGALPGAACVPALTIGFVVADATSLTSSETARQSLLESWCYTVSLIDDGASQADYDAAAASVDVIYVSSEASATQVGDKLTSQTTGIVSEDPDLHNDLGFSTVRYRAATNAPLTTVASHYITADFGGGDVTLYTSDQPSGAAAGTLPAGLVSVGDWSSGALAPLDGLLTLETGATISGGGTAAGRRVQLPWDGNEGAAVADIGALTTDGQIVLQRSLEWAAGSNLVLTPIAHWKFDETSGTTAIDSEGGHHGTLVGDASWAPGMLDGALSLDGSGDRVDVSGLIDSPSSLTIAAWVNLSSTDFYGAEVIDLGDNILLRLDNGFYDTYVSFWDGSGWQRTRTGQFIAGSGWRHVAYTHDDAANQQFFYIDGAEAAATTFSTSISYSHASNTAIGANSLGNSNYDFNGQIDDLRIYDVALSAAEIAELAAMGGSGGGGGGTGPVFESYADASASSTVTSLTVPMPAGTADGDLLVAALATDGDSAPTFSLSPGWTPVSVGTSANNKVSFGVWWKIATSSEPAQYTFNWTGSEEAYGWISRFTGHDPASPIIYDSGTLTNDSTSTPICQRLITTEDDVMILRLGGFDDDDITIGVPGLENHTAINMGRSGGGAGTTSGGSGYFVLGTAGDSDLARFQLTNNEEMRTVTLGIRPAP